MAVRLDQLPDGAEPLPAWQQAGLRRATQPLCEAADPLAIGLCGLACQAQPGGQRSIEPLAETAGALPGAGEFGLRGMPGE